MEYNTYLFDFDYTLANSERAIVTCFQYFLAQIGHSPVDEAVIKATIGMTMEESFTCLTGETDPKRLAHFRDIYRVKSDEIMTRDTKFYPDAIPLLQMLKAKGKQTGIISTKRRSRIEESLARYQIEALVDIVIGGEDVKEAKPSPEGLLFAMKKLGAQKEQILYVGDSLIDGRAAQNAGVDFVAVTTGVTKATDFQGLPYRRIIDRLGELI